MCVLLKKKLANQKHAITFDEIFIATPHQITKREKMLLLSLLSAFLSFFSFPLFSLLRPLLQISKGWLTNTPQKIITKSP